MTKGRLIAAVLILGVLAGLVAFTRLRAGDSGPTPSSASTVVASQGSASESNRLSADQFIEFWRHRVERDPRDYISYTELAAGFLRRARETGDVDAYTRAEAALQQALELNPKYESAVAYLATVRYAKHDFAGALETAQQVYSLNPGAAQALAVIGDANLELGRYNEADEAYDRLLRLSRSAPVSSRLARLAELQGRPEDAVRLLQQTVAEGDESGASPESIAWYYLQLGNLYFNTGNIEAAEKEYERALEAFPDYVHALAGLAKVHAAREDYDAAIALYSRVAARYPIPEYVIALGDVYAAAGWLDGATRQYDLVAAIDRLYKANGVNTDLQMAMYFADHDSRLDEALRQARAVYQQRPSIQAADTLAWALYKSGRYEESRAYSREALRLGTQDALMLFHAGMIEYRLDEYDEARTHLERAVKINPRFSLLYAETASETLDELRAVVRR